MSPVLEKVLQEMEQLTPEELCEAISSATEQLKRQTVTRNQGRVNLKAFYEVLEKNSQEPLEAIDSQPEPLNIRLVSLVEDLRLKSSILLGEIDFMDILFLLDLLGESGEPILIEKSGQPVAAIISYAELKRLKDIEEDARDSEMMRRAVEEHDGEFVTFEDAIAKYNKLHGTDFTPESIIND